MRRLWIVALVVICREFTVLRAAVAEAPDVQQLTAGNGFVYEVAPGDPTARPRGRDAHRRLAPAPVRRGAHGPLSAPPAAHGACATTCSTLLRRTPSGDAPCPPRRLTTTASIPTGAVNQPGTLQRARRSGVVPTVRSLATARRHRLRLHGPAMPTAVRPGASGAILRLGDVVKVAQERRLIRALLAHGQAPMPGVHPTGRSASLWMTTAIHLQRGDSAGTAERERPPSRLGLSGTIRHALARSLAG